MLLHLRPFEQRKKPTLHKGKLVFFFRTIDYLNNAVGFVTAASTPGTPVFSVVPLITPPKI